MKQWLIGSVLAVLPALACGAEASPPEPLPDYPAVRIESISVAGGRYLVYFDENVFDPEDLDLDNPEHDVGEHIHFFWDTVEANQAGLPGTGPWYGYVGNSPLRHYLVTDRPNGAERLCVVIANSDHSPRPGTGNCVEVPE